MGEDPKNVHITGSLALDNMTKMKLFSKKEVEKKLKIKFKNKNIIITLHPETLGKISQKKIGIILESLKKLNDTKFIFTLPNIDMGINTLIS